MVGLSSRSPLCRFFTRTLCRTRWRTVRWWLPTRRQHSGSSLSTSFVVVCIDFTILCTDIRLSLPAGGYSLRIFFLLLHTTITTFVKSFFISGLSFPFSRPFDGFDKVYIIVIVLNELLLNDCYFNLLLYFIRFLLSSLYLTDAATRGTALRWTWFRLDDNTCLVDSLVLFGSCSHFTNGGLNLLSQDLHLVSEKSDLLVGFLWQYGSLVK